MKLISYVFKDDLIKRFLEKINWRMEDARKNY